MRTLLVLTCCLALTAALGAEEQDNNKKNKKVKQTTQQAVTPSGHAAGAVRSHNRNSLGTEMKVHENARENIRQTQDEIKGGKSFYTPNNPDIGEKGKFK